MARPLNVVPNKVTSVLPVSMYRYSSLALQLAPNFDSTPAPTVQPTRVELLLNAFAKVGIANVQLTKQDGKPAMWVLNAEGNGVALRTVGIGGYSGDWVTVLDGLEQGDRVVTAGVHKLYETQKVRVWTEPVR